MPTTTQYALMAGASYESTRGEINRIPAPQGWIVVKQEETSSTGFEAVAFQSGTEIVISFAGTYTGQLGDLAADAQLGLGNMHPQLLQAVELYLSVKANPLNAGKSISLTGHSLGGGLASLVAVFFGELAQTFDQAPFAPAARNLGPSLYATLLGKGYSAGALAPLYNFNVAMAASGGGIITNAGNVTNVNVLGELLSPLAGGRIGSTLQDISNTSPGVSSNELHSQALLTAFLQSKETAPTGKALNEVTVKLTDLLKMIFDGNLFAFTTATTNTTQVNFLEQLVRHEAGVQGSITADAMVTRFTADLWKLAQDGGLTMSDGNPISTQFKDVSKTLIAFAMQKYYEETSASVGYGSKLFSDVTGGVQFDMLDVSAKFATAITKNQKLDLNDAKGYKEYFRNYLLQSTFTSAERGAIQSMLPYLRDWYVQAGANGLAYTDNLNRGAFMLGGIASDALVGGSKADLLVGNAGADVLQGRGGNDALIGGTGDDTYIYQTGDGLDTILDKDGSGSILYNGSTLAGGAQFGDNRVSKDEQGHTYTNVGGGRLIVDGAIVIEGWSAGALGLSMTTPVASPNPSNPLDGGSNPTSPNASTSNSIYGDRKPVDIDPVQDGVQIGYDLLGNLRTTTEVDADRVDTLYDSADVNDRIEAGGGSDTVVANKGGDDVILLGAGNDWGFGGAGNDVIEGGADTDIIVGEAGDDWLYADASKSNAIEVIPNYSMNTGALCQFDHQTQIGSRV